MNFESQTEFNSGQRSLSIFNVVSTVSSTNKHSKGSLFIQKLFTNAVKETLWKTLMIQEKPEGHNLYPALFCVSPGDACATLEKPCERESISPSLCELELIPVYLSR